MARLNLECSNTLYKIVYDEITSPRQLNSIIKSSNYVKNSMVKRTTFIFRKRRKKDNKRAQK